MNNFKQCLAYGQKFEKLAQKHVLSHMKQKHNMDCEIIEECNDNRYDFKIMDTLTKKTYTFEVKTDRASKKTNNFFIETQNRKLEPSGISTTKANFYIICDEDNFYMIPTNQLKYILINNSFTTRRVGTPLEITAVGFIVPSEVIIKQAKKIN
jgi:hypothetical protein